MKFVVKPHRPEAVRRRRLGLYALALFLFLSGWGLGWFWHARQLQTLAARVQEQAEKLEGLRAQNRQLQQENVDLQQRDKVKASALDDLRQQLSAMSRKLEQAHQELAFFNNLMDESVQNPGLAVHELHVLPTRSPRVYRYRLVLRQSLKKARELEGRYWFTLEGVQQDKSRRLRYPEGSGGLPYRFKYFETLQGQIDLPEGFVPASITVHLKPGGKRRGAGQKGEGMVETTLPWQPETS